MKAKDLTGQKFGMLTVIKRIENKNGKVCWLCQCDCGKTKEVKAINLTSKHTQSCGVCLKSGRKTKDIEVGSRFGKLVVLKSLGTRELVYKNGKGKCRRQYFLCQCDCGKQKEVSNSDLNLGVKSCGCGRGRPAKK